MDITIKKGAAASGFYLMRQPRIYIRPLYRGIAFIPESVPPDS